MHDRDAKFALEVFAGVKSVGLDSVRTSFRSPWQNGVAKRWVGGCRRDLLDHVIALNERPAESSTRGCQPSRARIVSADIRTTMNVYGDVVTDEMTTAGSKVAQLAFRVNRAQTERSDR